MPDMPDVRSVVEVAERAAAAGDYASAERALREAARLQEASLGPLHPELCNTLNNLGIVCEFTNKTTEAEQFFRRACAIATTALEPDHPFVATSRRNLEDFCEAHGIAIDQPAQMPAVIAEAQPPAHPPAGLQDLAVPIGPSVHKTQQPVAAEEASHPLLSAVLVAALLTVFVGASIWMRSGARPEPSPASASTPSSSPSPAAAASLSSGQSDETGAAATPPARPDEPAAKAAVAPETKRVVTAAPARSRVVAAALLCRTLTTASSRDWRCDPPAQPVSRGALTFYTRVRSPIDTTVEHRWYRGSQLIQAVELSIRANPADGYRTYSRYRIPAGAAEWRVELRSKDGVLLHGESFVTE